MPVAAAINPARGTVLKHGTPYSSPVYVAIAQVTSLDGPSREVGTRETTLLVSTVKTYAPTITDNGEVSGKLFYDPKSDSHVALDALIDTPALEKWEIVFNDVTNGPSTFAFDGILTKLAVTGIEVEASLEADFTIKISGAITRT